MMSDVIMDGVWIINVNPADKPWNFVVCAVIWAVIAVLIALFECLSSDCNGRETLMVCSAVSVVGILLGLFVGVMHNQYLKPVTYDVMIGDNVSFNEFTEQYEIIEQNGNIYTVKERNNATHN